MDDDEDLRPLFRCALGRVGPAFRMDWASGVEEALAVLRRRRHSFVVADCLLPDGSGLALERWAELFTPEAPFAMISAVPLRRELFREDGRTISFLPKPFSIAELQRFLQDLVERSHPARRRLAR